MTSNQLTLEEFARRQVFEVEATANLFRLLRQTEGASNGRLQVLFKERQENEKYAQFLKAVSWSEMLYEVNNPNSFRR